LLWRKAVSGKTGTASDHADEDGDHDEDDEPKQNAIIHGGPVFHFLS
jgi:hypothetical protein